MSLMSDNQPPEILKPGEKPFDFPAAFMPPQLSSVLSFWLSPAAAVRGGHLHPMLFHKFRVKTVAVMRFVTDELAGLAADEKAVKRLFRELRLMRRSACKAGGGRKAGSVRNGHDPAAFAAFCPADGSAPFFAGTKLPSMNASRMSMPPRSCKPAASTSAMRRNTPAFTHCWNRLRQAWRGGHRSGRPFHGAPGRSAHKMPFSTSRGSRGLRPRESFLRNDCKMTGSIFIHCLSVMSMWTI